MEIAVAVLAQYAAQSPLFLVWLAGMALSIANWQRYPKVSLLTLIVCVTLLAESLIMTYVTVALPVFLTQSGRSAAQVGTLFTAISLVRSFLNAVLWGLLLLAMFRWRGERSQAVAP